MELRRRSAAQSLSISALDLFASALGVFVLIFVLLLPFYLKRPSVEAELLGAEAELAEQLGSLDIARAEMNEAEDALSLMEDELGGARSRLAELEELLREELGEVARLESIEIPVAPPKETRQPAPEPRGGGPLRIEKLDLVIVMDVTGSMRNELADVQSSLMSIARILNRLSPELRLGFVAYRDEDAPPVIQKYDLRPMSAANLRDILRFVGSLSARGGGDVPEPVGRALEAAVSMAWRGEAKGRILVVGDAPIHPADRNRSLETAALFQRGGTGDYDRRVTTILTGSYEGARRYFAELAAAGGGEIMNHRGAMLESVLLAVLN